MAKQPGKTVQFTPDQLLVIKAYRDGLVKDLGLGVSLADAVMFAVTRAAKARSMARKRAANE